MEKFKKLFKRYKIDGYIVPKNDEYFNEYIHSSKDRLKFIRKHKLNDKIKEKNEDKILYKRLQSKINAFTDPPGKTLLINKNNSIYEKYARTIAYFRIPMYEEAILSINSLLKDATL